MPQPVQTVASRIEASRCWDTRDSASVSGGHGLSRAKSLLASYLEAIELELQILLLVEQLLESVCEDDVRVV